MRQVAKTSKTPGNSSSCSRSCNRVQPTNASLTSNLTQIMAAAADMATTSAISRRTAIFRPLSSLRARVANLATPLRCRIAPSLALGRQVAPLQNTSDDGTAGRPPLSGSAAQQLSGSAVQRLSSSARSYAAPKHFAISAVLRRSRYLGACPQGRGPILHSRPRLPGFGRNRQLT